MVASTRSLSLAIEQHTTVDYRSAHLFRCRAPYHPPTDITSTCRAFTRQGNRCERAPCYYVCRSPLAFVKTPWRATARDKHPVAGVAPPPRHALTSACRRPRKGMVRPIPLQNRQAEASSAAQRTADWATRAAAHRTSAWFAARHRLVPPALHRLLLPSAPPPILQLSKRTPCLLPLPTRFIAGWIPRPLPVLISPYRNFIWTRARHNRETPSPLSSPRHGIS